MAAKKRPRRRGGGDTLHSAPADVDVEQLMLASVRRASKMEIDPGRRHRLG